MFFLFALSVYGVFYSSLWWISVAGSVLLWFALVSFFRNPWRIIPKDLPEGMMLSPADGVVSAIEFLDEHETVDGPAVLIRIFLSVLNVHINRMPCDCELGKTLYRKGRFLDARSEESAKINESNTLFLFTNGERIGMRQVSGKIARNIVCPIHNGDRFRQGQQFGMIKYGSTAELILPRPDHVKIHVAKGDSVRGGLTRIATLTPQTQ
ncbi:MAG TPA: phosphatidylserine decarboxylase family protein [Phycisphaerales bacterium]|nr:phosphatidylserine decarboxylase family protein [Phycisphaerales bacterium]HIB01482.1 phosphatidylserine decarboxylase family protein [Phycisphaerales bacterium]HIB50540.1 phosphatidylserine decarboxylase family protein [Phycisphaerales bacterium]HIN83899.1 phosphatidylserine decarboxylase family protein [Phycisphaerales bacterium]HIO19787.1 phosphatidylserine decarboxylase family protein [Phycisphaerales bacterium]